jgi:drug/metabolite transporter (DMT)-like permease
MGCFVKLITSTSDMSSIEIVFFRAVFQITIVFAAMFFFTTPVQKIRTDKVTTSTEDSDAQQQQQEYCCVEEPLIRHPFGLTKDIVTLVVVRGMCGACGFCFYFYTISVLPLGDAVTILSLNPVMTVVIASVVLHEPLTKTHIFSAVSSVVGSVFLARPSFLFGKDSSMQENATSRQWGYLTGILGACTGAGVYILIRKAGKKGVHTLTLLFGWCVFGLLFSAVIVTFWGTFTWPSSTRIWVYLLVSCIFGTLAHGIMNFAARLAPAGVASILRSSGIVWSYLLEVVVFHEIPRAWTILGVGLILASLGIIAFEKRQEGQQHLGHADMDDHSNRNHSTLQLQNLNSKDNFIRKTSDSSHGSLDDEFRGLIDEENLDRSLAEK